METCIVKGAVVGKLRVQDWLECVVVVVVVGGGMRFWWRVRGLLRRK